MTIERMLPLYQGMMTSFYDHRAADVVRSETAAQRQNQPRYLTDDDKADPSRLAIPQYWVRESLLDESLPEWLIGFSSITSPTNERTLSTTAIPRAGVGNSLAVVLSGRVPEAHCLLACLSSYVVDFLMRQKVGGGTNLNFFYVKQIAAMSPSLFSHPCAWAASSTISAWIAPRVAELVATADDTVAFAEALGIHGAPFRWDPERRAILRAELDAAFFQLYGVARADVDYIMDTFPIVRRHDEQAHGEYRTKRLILEIYDALAAAARSGTPYQTRLSPPPADPSCAHTDSTNPA